MDCLVFKGFELSDEQILKRGEVNFRIIFWRLVKYKLKLLFFFSLNLLIKFDYWIWRFFWRWRLWNIVKRFESGYIRFKLRNSNEEILVFCLRWIEILFKLVNLFICLLEIFFFLFNLLFKFFNFLIIFFSNFWKYFLNVLFSFLRIFSFKFLF